MASFLTQARRALFGLTPTEQQFQNHFGTPDQAEVLAQHAQATQAMHVQVAARPPGKLSTGGNKAAKVPPKATDLHCWAKFVPSATKDYKGDFGFDWMEWERHAPLVMRKPNPTWKDALWMQPAIHITSVMGVPIANFEYCYDKQKQQYVPVAEDDYLKQRLQDEYERLTVYGEDYFAAWLSLWPKQEITLHLRIEALNQAAAKGDYLTFAPHAYYQVTANDQVNQAIRIPLRGGNDGIEITIKCLRACTATSLKVLDEKGTVVGQLNVVSNTKTYNLPIRVVYLVKEGPAAATEVKQLQQSFESLSLENYLNSRALNQALIKVRFERSTQVHKIYFKEANWEGKFYDKKNNWFNDYDVVDSRTKLKTGTQKLILDEVLDQYKEKYEGKQSLPFRGILLVLTNIEKNPIYNVGGESNFVPYDFREALIYGRSVKKKFIYAHEIGHALGLEHSFFDSHDPFEAMKKSILYFKDIQKRLKIKIGEKRKIINKHIDFMKNETNFYEKHPIEKQKAEGYIYQQSLELQALKKDDSENNDILSNLHKRLLDLNQGTMVASSNPYKFKKYTTKNIMDYSEETNNYFHWQWKVVQRDVLNYYGN